jgi:hypothetical protein
MTDNSQTEGHIDREVLTLDLSSQSKDELSVFCRYKLKEGSVIFVSSLLECTGIPLLLRRARFAGAVLGLAQNETSIGRVSRSLKLEKGACKI